MTKKKKPSWRTWHLVALFVIGSIIERAGERMREWSGGKLKDSWFA